MDPKEIRNKILEDEKEIAERMKKYRGEPSEDFDIKPDYEYEHPVWTIIIDWMMKFEDVLLEKGILKENPYGDETISEDNWKTQKRIYGIMGVFMSSIIIAIMHSFVMAFLF